MAAKFPPALKAVLDELQLSQIQFADLTGMSQTMVAKLLNREERASDETYQKIFDYLRRDSGQISGEKRLDFARRLSAALIKDLIRDLRMPKVTTDSSSKDEQPYIQDGDEICSRSEATVGRMFDQFKDDVILALWALGKRANSDPNFQNLLFSCAEIANIKADEETSEMRKTATWLPTGHFQKRLSSKPKNQSSGRLMKGEASRQFLNFRFRSEKPI